MSINPVLTHDFNPDHTFPLPLPNEHFVLSRKHISFSLKSASEQHLHLENYMKGEGVLFLTNKRIVLLKKGKLNTHSHCSSFQLNLRHISCVKYKKPILCADYLTGRIQQDRDAPHPLSTDAKWKIQFDNGSCETFLRAFFAFWKRASLSPAADVNMDPSLFDNTVYMGSNDPSVLYITQPIPAHHVEYNPSHFNQSNANSAANVGIASHSHNVEVMPPPAATHAATRPPSQSMYPLTASYYANSQTPTASTPFLYDNSQNSYGNNQPPYANTSSPYGDIQPPPASTSSPYGNIQPPPATTSSPYGNMQPPYANASSPYGYIQPPPASTSSPYGNIQPHPPTTSSPYGNMQPPYANASSPYGDVQPPPASTSSPYGHVQQPYGHYPPI